MQYIAQAQQKQNTINTTTPYAPPVKEKSKINSIIPISGILVISLLAIAIITWYKHKRKTKNKSKPALAASQSKTSETIDNPNHKIDPSSSIANPTSNTSSSQPKSKPTILAKLKHKLKTFGTSITATKRRQRLSAIVGILLIAGVGQIVYSSFAATTEYSPIPEVAKMQKLTEEVVTLTDEYATMPDTVATKKNGNQPNEAKTVKKQELIAKVKERKDAYKLAMQYDPQASADSYLKQATLDKLPQESKLDIEQPIVLEGVWVRGSSDSPVATGQNTRSPKSKTIVQVQQKDGSRISVYAKSLPDYDTGAPVKIFGSLIESKFVAALPSIVSSVNITSQTQALCPGQDQQSDCVKNIVQNLIDSINQAELMQRIAEQRQNILQAGASADQMVYCRALEGVSCDRDPSISVTAENYGQRKFLIIPFRFPGQDAEFLRQEQQRQGGATPTIQQLQDMANRDTITFDQESYGQFKPEISVYDQVIDMPAIFPDDPNTQADEEINLTDGLYDCERDIDTILRLATATVINNTPGLRERASGTNTTDIISSFDAVPCRDDEHDGVSQPFLGLAFSPSSPRFGDIIKGGMFINWAGGDGASDTAGSPEVIMHEYTHVFGVLHAGIACDVGECLPGSTDEQTIINYGDPYNMMGNFSRSHSGPWATRDSKSVNIVQKTILGWIEDKDVKCIALPDTSWDSDTSIASNLRPTSFSLNALWQNTGTRGVRIIPYAQDNACSDQETTTKGAFDTSEYAIEYRPKTANGPDNFNAGAVTPGILVYKVGGTKGSAKSGQASDTALMNGRQVDGVAQRDYTNAAVNEPFIVKDDDGEQLFCIIPTNPTDGGVDVTIATDCPKNETTNYVYEKSINTTSKYNSTDLEVDKNGNMYIMESNAKRVSILNNDGSTKSSFTINLDISLIVDAKFAVDDDGNIFVSTVQKTGSYTSMPYLVKFDQNGNELARWEPGSLGNNSGVVAHDRISEINVDTKNNVFFRFERYGNPAWSDFTESYIVKYNNSLSEEIKKWKLQNSYTGSSFAIDPFNNVYGFERGKWNHSLTGWNLLKENCVHKFSSEGIDLARWCKANPEYNGADKLVNSDNDAFISFDHMMVDKDSNYLMLSSWSSSYAVMYGSGHNYIGRIGEGFGGFSSIKLAEDGKLYAPSLIRPEILVFSPTTKPIEYKTLNN